ncbi:MAG: UDP-N-acetylmuramoyl-tripeptide--D-alanyl-D-alanine ligase [Candidatus Fimenecus sp.]
MRLTLREIEQITGGTLCGQNTEIEAVTIDSREVPQNALYVAIKGDRFDGHDFCAAAVENGIAAIVSERDLPLPVPYIKVENTRQALLDIAKLHRNHHKDVKVIGLTGSVGKTTTKEMTYAALSSQFETVKTEGNLNNEIGMPKTLFRIDESTEAAVIEMGMNHFGEIARMTAACQPDAAIITNIGVSHIEFLGSRDGILQAKTEILQGMQTGAPLILNGDDDKLWGYENPDYKLIYFGIDNQNADVRAEELREENGETTFTVCFDGKTQSVRVPTVGKHNVYDALAAFTAGLVCEIAPEKIAVGLQNFVPAGMRQRIQQVGGITVIEDCYNASPDSQKAALNVLCATNAKRKIAVLGDMLELGSFSESAHRAVGSYAAEKQVDLLYCYGQNAAWIADAAKDNVKAFHFTEKTALFDALLSEVRADDAILFKASRGMALEEVIEKLYGEWKKQ